MYTRALLVWCYTTSGVWTSAVPTRTPPQQQVCPQAAVFPLLAVEVEVVMALLAVGALGMLERLHRRLPFLMWPRIDAASPLSSSGPKRMRPRLLC